MSIKETKVLAEQLREIALCLQSIQNRKILEEAADRLEDTEKIAEFYRKKAEEREAMDLTNYIDGLEKRAAESIKAEQGAYIVYKHTCPNGKVYIGITSQTPRMRFQCGRGYKHSSHFYSAIQKYGWDNIKHEILYAELTKEEAEQKEIELIRQHKSNDRRFGYNISDGGLSHKQTEETKRKISEKKQNISAETRAKLSVALKGKRKPKELCELWSEQRKGKQAVKVLCVETGIVYNSIREAGEAVGVHPTNISRSCRHKKGYENSKGLHWERVREEANV